MRDSPTSNNNGVTGSLGSGLKRMLRNAVAYGTRRRGWRRFQLYFFIAAMVLLLIWVPVLLFLKYSPVTYTSKWTLILPGTGLGASVNLESIGQTATSVSSPYTSPSLDPRANYKAILVSQPVLAAASTAMNLSEKAFGEPRIKLVDQTALMHFTISGDSAEQAQRKATTLNHAFLAELDRLRLDETRRRGDAAQSAIQSFQDNLDQIQRDILDYQANSAVISVDQQRELTVSIEQMRRERASLQARYSMAKAKLEKLTATLALSPELASDALLLNADPVFRGLLDSYAQAQATLTDYLGKWGPRHPQVKPVQELIGQSEQALRRRSRSLLGARAPQDKLPAHLLALLLSDSNDNRSALLQTLVLDAATRSGIAEQVHSLSRSLAQFDKRLRQNVDAAATLADLQRKHQVATAVFSSALAQLDLGKSNPYASYPLVQTLAEPTLPDKPDTLKRILALLGAVAGTFSTLIGLGLLWQRQAFLRKILKND